MEKRSLIVIILLLAILVIALGYIYSENSKKSSIEKEAQIANPASTYCVNHGGNISIKKDTSGAEYGVCIFANGSECEEWKFFRGECDFIQNNESCSVDSDCVPSSCCHPDSCVNKNSAPNCKGKMCTMECRSGTLDCGYGSCACTNSKCSASMK